VSNPPKYESNVFVHVYSDAVELKAESEKSGRPIFKDIPHIRITIPGDTNNIIERKLTEKDKHKYPKAWEEFQRGESQGFTGTPLEQWPQITRAQVKESKYFECHTVEQLAGLTDSHCQKMGMGFRELREKAKAYLGVAESTAVATAQAAENERLRQEMAELRAMIAESNEKKVGRPRKEAEAQA
jgi:hypothetical protein